MKTIPPAEGERRAISGYYPQYQVAAALILKTLREGRLDWIRMADPEAGRVDDFQIASGTHLDAYQVKWSQHPGTITFSNLVDGTVNAPSLIAQLADGWKRLRVRSGSLHVRVHLVSNDLPSVAANTNLPTGHPAPGPRHFAAFLEQAWKPYRLAPPALRGQVPAPWLPAWEKLASTSGLSPDEFDLFTHDCELELGYRLPSLADSSVSEDQLLEHDIEQLAYFLFKLVADPRREVELGRDELLERLGWKSRVEYRSKHVFPVDQLLYEPIVATVQRVEAALASLPGGYIGVLGSPGSGKSTLLTQTLRYREELIFRYYAYVPDAQDPIVLRGEADNFLHDIVLEIEHAGFSAGTALSPNDYNILLARFHKQLGLLHENWKETGRKAVFLIDGLDHIAREQKPIHSLLRALPFPEQIPEGVFFILGSQTDQLADLPDRVQQSIQQPERRIEIKPLTREAVLKLLDKAKLGTELSSDQRDHVYQLTEGHPLAFSYFLKQLSAARTEDEIRTVLATGEHFQGNIEAQYYSYWRSTVQDDYGFLHLLGLLARMRRLIDMQWLETWADPAAIQKLRSTAYQYFRIESPQRWYFFHNSFRIFLIEQTAKAQPQGFDTSRDASFHHELAEQCRLAPPDSYWSWEELYHRICAHEEKAALERASADLFRGQMRALRRMDAISVDIQLLIQAAARLRDPVSLAKVLLLGVEFEARESNLEDADLPSLLLNLGSLQACIEHVCDGNRLRISSLRAIPLSLFLWKSGFVTEAEHVFSLAEPLDMLSGAKVIDEHDSQGTNLLDGWAQAAVSFRDPITVISTVRQIVCETRGRPDRDPAVITRSVQNHFLLKAGLELAAQKRWDGLEAVIAALDGDAKGDVRYRLWLLIHAWREAFRLGEKAQARLLFEQASALAARLDLEDEGRVAFAEGALRILGRADEARKWLAGVPQPNIPTDILGIEADLAPFLHRFRLNRLLFALGSTSDPLELVPDAAQARDQGLVVFERAICVISKVWAAAWTRTPLTEAIFEREIIPLVRFYYQPPDRHREWTSWYAIKALQSEFYALMIDAIAEHGFEQIDKLRLAFESEWSHSETSGYWPADVRRTIVTRLAQLGAPAPWLRKQLEEIQDKGQGEDHLRARIKALGDLAAAWLAVGEKGAARTIVQDMLRMSLGISYDEDYQLNTWISWLDNRIQYDSGDASRKVAWFARALTPIRASVGAAVSAAAAEDLLGTAFRWNPAFGITLARWLRDQGLISFEKTTKALLEAALSKDQQSAEIVLHLLGELLLPIAIQADSDLCRHMLEVYAGRFGGREAGKALNYLAGRVRTYALPSTRAGWMRGLSDANRSCQLGIALVESSAFKDDEASSDSALKLTDGTQINLADVVRQINTADDIIRLVNQKRVGSSFDWSKVIMAVAPKLSGAEIELLGQSFHSDSYASRIFSLLSRRLLELGDRSTAWRFGEEALALSNSYGWSRRYDGGTRIEAFHALARVDGERARGLAFETFARDIASSPWMLGSILADLKEITELLAGAPLINQIWPDVEIYVDGLFAGYGLPDTGPWPEDVPMDEGSAAAAISKWLLEYLHHPVNLVQQAAQRACTSLVVKKEAEILQALRESLAKPGEHQLYALMVLAGAASEDPAALKTFQGLLPLCHESPNYAIRRMSEDLIRKVEEPLPPTHVERPLPPIYNLVLPGPREDLERFASRPRRGQPLPNTRVPSELLHIWKHELEAVAASADVPLENLQQRVLQIMGTLADPASWSAEGERRLHDHLEQFNLEFAFRRPRAELSRQAFFYAVAELLDAGKLRAEHLEELEWTFRFFDPALVMGKPEERPEVIQGIVDIRRDSSYHEDWVRQLEPSINSLAAGLHGCLILGEETMFTHLAWEKPSETRMQKLVLASSPSLATEPTEDTFFEKVLRRTLSDYHWIYLGGHASSTLVVQHSSFGYDTPAESWLALNPMVGHALGWVLSSDGYFHWVNREGQTMARSVWWMDGLIAHQPPKFDDEVGEGWLVVAAPKALAEITAEFGPVVRQALVLRTLDTEEGMLTRRLVEFVPS